LSFLIVKVSWKKIERGLHKNINSTTVFTFDNMATSNKSSKSALEWFLKDYVTIKTEVMAEPLTSLDNLIWGEFYEEWPSVHIEIPDLSTIWDIVEIIA